MENPTSKGPIITNIQSTDLPAVRKFMDRAYKPNDVTCFEDYFRWQFDRCGGVDRSLNNRALMTREADGNVIGICLVPAYEIAMRDQIVRGGWIHHWFTEPSRGTIGMAMLTRLLRDLPFFGGAGISSQGLAAMRVSCPKLVTFELTRLFAVFDIDATYELIFDHIPATRTYLRTLRLPAPAASTRFDVIDTFDDAYERSWDIMRSELLFATHRSAKYMNWRYFEHPYFKYRTVQCRGNHGDVYYVWREEEIHGTGRFVIRLCDVIGPMTAIGETFPAAAMAMAESKPLFVDFFCSNAEVIAGLMLGGMHPAVTRPDFDLPRLFQPLAQISAKSLHFYYRLLAPFPENSVTAFSNSYITKSDSNQDRPNLIV